MELVLRQTRPDTTYACLTCQSHKRKCDRGLPSCSRCLKNKRPCHYRPQLSVNSAPKARANKTACLECHSRKKRCDGQRPSCSYCQTKQLSCTYTWTSSTTRTMLPSSDEHFEILYPIGGQSDILTMMHLYNATAGSIAGPIKPESVFWRLKNEWIPFALTDPAIYHASLYLASTFQDRLRARIQPRPGMAIESRATLYHQAHAAHYISQKIARCEADDALLAAIQVMILQAIMAKDTITLLQHLRGFVGLLKLYGGVEGMKCLQLIAGAIRVNTIVASMIFDGDPHCTLLPKAAPDEPLPFLTWAVPRIKARPAPEYPLAAVDLFCYAIDALNSFHHQATDLERSNPFTSTFTEWLFITHGLWPEDFTSTPDPSLEATWLAMDCLWYIMSPGRGEENILNDHVAKIKTAIAKVPALTWFQDAPEAFLFAVLVASAAALKRPDLVWLSTFGQFLTSALLGQDNEVYLYFWPCHVGVRAVRRVKMGRVLEDW